MTPLDIHGVVRALAQGTGRGPSVPPEGERYAAVAIVLRAADSGVEVLLILRAKNDRDPWSGHMAFPGGRHDESDVDLLHTATRETLEEVGVDLARVGTLVGRLDDLPAIARGRRAGITIAPFVFTVSEDPPLSPNHEVEEALWVPLDSLASGETATTVRYRMEGTDLDLHGWDVGGRIVWGLTYRMLQTLFERLGLTGSRLPADRTSG